MKKQIHFSRVILFTMCCIFLTGCSTVNLPDIKYHVKTDAPLERKFLEKGIFSVKCFVHKSPSNLIKLKLTLTLILSYLYQSNYTTKIHIGPF